MQIKMDFSMKNIGWNPISMDETGMRCRDNGRRGGIHSPTNKQKRDYTS